jgi:hypothetical protein
MWRSNFTIPHSFAAYILDIRLYFGHPPIFWTSAYILRKRLHFEQAPIFYACANILGKSQYFDNFCNVFLLDFVAANICVYFQYLFMHFLCANIFGAIVLKPRIKIVVVIMII